VAWAIWALAGLMIASESLAPGHTAPFAREVRAAYCTP
jgi:hypothetical protein